MGVVCMSGCLAVGSPLVTRVSGTVTVLDPSPRGLVRKLLLLENPCEIRLVSGIVESV